MKKNQNFNARRATTVLAEGIGKLVHHASPLARFEGILMSVGTRAMMHWGCLRASALYNRIAKVLGITEEKLELVQQMLDSEFPDFEIGSLLTSEERREVKVRLDRSFKKNAWVVWKMAALLQEVETDDIEQALDVINNAFQRKLDAEGKQEA